MLATENKETIIRADDNEYVEIPLPGSKGILTKIIKVDEAINQVVMQVRFLPNSKAPRHYHYCRAIAYTVSGEWEYDEGKFGPGDIAYEVVGNLHTPSSEKGGELVLVMTSDDNRFLDNYMEDGSIIRYTMDTFKFLAGKKQSDLNSMNFMKLFSHIDFIPSSDKTPKRLIQDIMLEMRE